MALLKCENLGSSLEDEEPVCKIKEEPKQYIEGNRRIRTINRRPRLTQIVHVYKFPVGR